MWFWRKAQIFQSAPKLGSQYLLSQLNCVEESWQPFQRKSAGWLATWVKPEKLPEQGREESVILAFDLKAEMAKLWLIGGVEFIYSWKVMVKQGSSNPRGDEDFIVKTLFVFVLDACFLFLFKPIKQKCNHSLEMTHILCFMQGKNIL